MGLAESRWLQQKAKTRTDGIVVVASGFLAFKTASHAVTVPTAPPFMAVSR